MEDSFAILVEELKECIPSGSSEMLVDICHLHGVTSQTTKP